MPATVYYVIHVLSLLLLTGMTFGAFAAPDPEVKRKTHMWTGILSILMLVGGFGLLARLGYGWQPWVLGKVVLWLALSVMAGFAFRKREMVGTLRLITIVVLGLALYLVYFKPGHEVVTSPVGAEIETPAQGN